MAFTYLKVKSAKCICLLPMVLVLVLLFWSWSEEFGLVYITVTHSHIAVCAEVTQSNHMSAAPGVPIGCVDRSIICQAKSTAR